MEIIAIILTSVCMCFLPNILQSKHIKLKIPRFIYNLLFFILSIASMSLMFLGFYNMNIFFIITGIIIYSMIILTI